MRPGDRLSDDLVPKDPFDALIARLAVLSKKHLLFFRVEVGKTRAQEA